ncbi:MAG: hypothetical protein WBN96_13700 [Gammaproteobacteria bacterium]
MESLNRLFLFSVSIALSLIMGGCGSDDAAITPAENNTYATTSSKGDYSEWTIIGNQLDATLNVVSTTGEIEYTFTIDAACAAPNSFGVRSCTIASSSCADGTLVCPAAPTGLFEMMDVPGVALFVNIGSGASEQLHVGFAKDNGACIQDVSGDYTMIHTGLGLNENFGMYRSDANFITIHHSDFGFYSTADTVTPTVVYRTGSEMETFADDGCDQGVRTRSLGSLIIRTMMTASGLFVLDFPAGQGGLISFKTSNAATLADFANKTFGGISFPDAGDVAAVSAVFGPVASSKVEFTVSSSASPGTETQSIMALATPASVTAPAYPDFSVAPTTAPGGNYTSTNLYMDYASPAAIPGLFKLDGMADSGRVIIAAMKFNSKVIGVGMVYNWRNMGDPNPATGGSFTQDGLYNTGNFIIFEK